MLKNVSNKTRRNVSEWENLPTTTMATEIRIIYENHGISQQI